MNVFERYLTLWVARVHGPRGRAREAGSRASWTRCAHGVRRQGSQINIPIAVLIWLMIYPMMLKIDFASIRGVGRRPARAPRHARS